jgi:hypothetical protein
MARWLMTYDATFEGRAFSFALADRLMVRCVRREDGLRITIDLPDHTRAAAELHPVQ